MKKPNDIYIVFCCMFTVLALAVRNAAGILFAVSALISAVIFIIETVRSKRN